MNLRDKYMALLMAIGGQEMPQITDKAEFGLFTPTQDEYQYSIQHHLGRVPEFAIVFDASGDTIQTGNAFSIVYGYIISATKASFVSIINTNRTGYLSAQMTNKTYPMSIDEHQVTFATGNYYSGRFLAGTTYQYILW